MNDEPESQAVDEDVGDDSRDVVDAVRHDARLLAVTRQVAGERNQGHDPTPIDHLRGQRARP